MVTAYRKSQLQASVLDRRQKKKQEAQLSLE